MSNELIYRVKTTKENLLFPQCVGRCLLFTVLAGSVFIALYVRTGYGGGSRGDVGDASIHVFDDVT